MGSNNANVAKESESVQNNILQASFQQCKSDCTNISSGNTVIFNGSNISGDVDFNQSCSATAHCIMEQQLQSQVQNMMSAIAQQQQEVEKSILSFTVANDVNYSEINENIVNSITQILQSSCQATSSNITNDNLVILNNTNVEGSFSFSQTGNATANCTMNNLARQVAFNQQQAKTNQTQKIESIFAIIAIAVIVVVIVGAIIVFLTLRGGSGSSNINVGEKGEKGKSKSSGLLGDLSAEDLLLL